MFRLSFSFLIVITRVLSRTGRSGTCDTSGTQQALNNGMGGRAVLTDGNSRFTLSIAGGGYTTGSANPNTIWINRTTGTAGFRGLLLYAVNSQNTRIGTLTAPTSTFSQDMSPTYCSGPTLTHTSASSYLSHQMFSWIVPDGTTGELTIHAIAYEAGSTFNVPSPLRVQFRSQSPTLTVTNQPTSNPTKNPTKNPSSNPTKNPSTNPSTNSPTNNPTKNPTKNPSSNPTKNPSKNPATTNPTANPTKHPTKNPTKNPTSNPSGNPTTASPTTFSSATTSTRSQTSTPTSNPTSNPTKNPSKNPATTNPTANPTKHPTKNPTKNPTSNPTKNPSRDPSRNPSKNPSKNPTQSPTARTMTATTTTGMATTTTLLHTTTGSRTTTETSPSATTTTMNVQTTTSSGTMSTTTAASTSTQTTVATGSGTSTTMTTSQTTLSTGMTTTANRLSTPKPLTTPNPPATTMKQSCPKVCTSPQTVEVGLEYVMKLKGSIKCSDMGSGSCSSNMFSYIGNLSFPTGVQCFNLSCSDTSTARRLSQGTTAAPASSTKTILLSFGITSHAQARQAALSLVPLIQVNTWLEDIRKNVTTLPALESVSGNVTCAPVRCNLTQTQLKEIENKLTAELAKLRTTALPQTTTSKSPTQASGSNACMIGVLSVACVVGSLLVM